MPRVKIEYYRKVEPLLVRSDESNIRDPDRIRTIDIKLLLKLILLEPIGHIPPVEYEEMYCQAQAAPVAVAEVN